MQTEQQTVKIPMKVEKSNVFAVFAIKMLFAVPKSEAEIMPNCLQFSYYTDNTRRHEELARVDSFSG